MNGRSCLVGGSSSAASPPTTKPMHRPMRKAMHKPAIASAIVVSITFYNRAVGENVT